MLKLKVVFAHPLFERQLKFSTDPITSRPNFLWVLKVIGDLVKAAKYPGKRSNEWVQAHLAIVFYYSFRIGTRLTG
jgi:hypothetical protein